MLTNQTQWVGLFCNFAFHAQEQANLTNANLEGALVTGNTSFKGAVITGAGMSQAVIILEFSLIMVLQSKVSPTSNLCQCKHNIFKFHFFSGWGCAEI
jgi:uncharacterized protein YjbI with pentapeptide repeats